MIQPLVLRANQGDCVKMTLRNQMEAEDGSLFIQASSMIVSSTGEAGDDHESGCDRVTGQSPGFRVVYPSEHAGRCASVPLVEP